MKPLTTLIALSLGLGLICFNPASAQGGFATLEIGKGEIDIDAVDRLPFMPASNANNDDGLAAVIGGGYEFANGVYVDLTFFEIDTVSLFGIADIFELRSTKIGVGYAIPASDRFNFLIKTGVAIWDLDTTESLLFNPGPEASTGFDGTDLFFELGMRWRVGDRFRISLTHTFDTHDLGDASSTRLGTQFFWGN